MFISLIAYYQVSSKKYAYFSFIFLDDPSCDPDIEPPMDERLEFCCVFESRLNHHRLFYRAEMDGTLVEGSSMREDFPSVDLSEEQVLKKLRKLQFVELKTNKLIDKYSDMVFRWVPSLSYNNLFNFTNLVELCIQNIMIQKILVNF